MRHLGIVASSAPQGSAPTITIASTTNYNQSIATFNATVNPNGGSTSVKFQYSTDNSSWTDGETISGLTGGSQSVYSNKTGLSSNVLYYVRAIATNAFGSNTSSSTSFTTWHLINFANGGAATYNVTIPTVTPTGGSAVIPSLYNILVVGGGSGSNFGGGSGGAYSWLTSRTFNNASNTSITATIGAGGSPNASGGSSSITGSSFATVSAAGGTVGTYPDGGSIPSIPSYGGAGFDYTDGAKSPTFSQAGGGGAGADGAGGAASSSWPGSYNGAAYGGNGGNAYYNSTWSVYVGGGGGGGFNATNGGGSGAGEPYSYWGHGGNCSGPTDAAGIAGAIWFQYYGP